VARTARDPVPKASEITFPVGAAGSGGDEEAQVSRTTQAKGETFEAALTAAVADLLGTRPEKVELRVEAAGLEELTGRLDLELRIEPDEADAPAPSSEEDDAAPETAEPTERGEDAASETSEDSPNGTPDDELTAEDLDEEADAAADFLEGLLDAMDLPGDLRIHLREDHAEVEIIDLGSGALIGRRGQTLESIQELLRCAMQRQFQRRCRVKVDAEGYRARRLEKLLEKAEDAIDEVLDSGESVRLEPMDVFERKAIHRLVAENDGVASRSQGREPARRVIIETED
jgi:spoIIIJ-associated protein